MLISTQKLDFKKPGPDSESVHMFVYEFPSNQIELAIECIRETKSKVFMNHRAIRGIANSNFDDSADVQHFKKLLKHNSIGGVFFTDRNDALLFQLTTGAKPILDALVHISVK